MKRKAKSPAKMTPKQIYEALSAPFAPEAYEPFEDGSGFIGIKAAYRTERLNQVLGPDGWEQSEPKYVSCEILRNGELKTVVDPESGNPIWEATCQRTVTIKALRKKYHGVGGHRDQKRGWAMAGAATAATNNALKDLIGVEVYKGLKDQPAANGDSRGEWIEGTLDAAYFSTTPATATISGERMHISSAMVKPFQRLWAEESQRQDSDAGKTVNVRWLPSFADSAVKCIMEVR